MSAAEPAAVTWTEIPGGRYTPVRPAGTGITGFTLLDPATTGLRFTNHLSDASAANNRILENGSGIALGDVDGDGLCDIYLCRLEGDNALYRNRGDGSYEDITAAAGVACPGQYSTGAVLADVDGDGDLDLLVNGIGTGTRLFLNDGRGRFTEMTGSRLVRRFGATSMALADMDGDGDLDLYVTNYRTDTFRDDPPGLRVEAARQPDGTITVKPEGRFIPLTPREGGVEVIERGERDFLYMNQGEGRFAPVSWTSGAFLDEEGQPLKEVPTDWGMSVMFRDFTGDGLPDLYVCNDFAYWTDRIWINEGGQRFRAAARTRFRSQSLASMSVDVADINRDGRDDLFVADMLSRRHERRAWQRPNTLEGLVSWPKSEPLFRPEVPRNTLHLARDDGSFAEIACLAGLAATEWTWSAVFLDVDLDGWEDLLIASGSNHDVQHADVLAALAQTRQTPGAASRLKNLTQFPRRPTGLQAFQNGHDLSFADAGAAWRFDHEGVPTALALADLDNDGDLDVVVNQLNGPALILRNDSPAPRVSVRLRGRSPNTRGIGARLRLVGGPVTQTQEMIAGGRYLSSDDPVRTFAASPDRPMTLEVTWRSGRRTTVADVRANRRYEIDEPGAGPVMDREASPVVGHFEDWSGRLAHRHQHAGIDEFARQSLLPRQQGTRGPALGWIDVDGDGRDDLIIGAGRGGTNAVRLRGPDGRFTGVSLGSGLKTGGRAVVGVIGFGGTHGPSILLALSNWEDADPNAPALSGSGVFAGMDELLHGVNPGAIAAADLDHDGVPEVFVGNRCQPARWPEAGPSYLLRFRAGHWQIDQEFPDAGMVTGGLFTDLDGDGAADLVTVAEAGTPRIWFNRKGRLEAAGTVPGISEWSGWWQTLAAGDFDGDGRMDLVAGNWGDNWRTDVPDAAHAGTVLAWGEYAGPGRVEPVWGAQDPWLGRVVPWRERKVIAATLPWVAAAFPTHADFGRASLTDVLGPEAARSHDITVRTGRSMVWLNRGGRFEPVDLPVEAQFSPAMGLAVADVDGDGTEDLFLAQNFFATDAETSRQDAGCGLWLRGDGHGHFTASGPGETGIRMDGEGRGVTVADVDDDGRPDLAAGVFGGETRLYRNRGPAEYWTVGMDRNVAAGGAGTRVQVRFAGGWSPAREVRIGNGGGNQDAARLGFAGRGDPMELRIRWPDGRSEQRAWPAGVRQVVLPLKR